MTTYNEALKRMKWGDKAAIARLAGVDTGRFWQYETGKRKVSWDKAKRLSNAFHKIMKITVRPEYFMEGWLRGNNADTGN